MNSYLYLKNEKTAIAFGHNQAALSHFVGSNVYVSLLSASTQDEGAYAPATDTQIFGVESITALRDFLSATLKRFDERNNPNPVGLTPPSPEQLNKNLSP